MATLNTWSTAGGGAFGIEAPFLLAQVEGEAVGSYFFNGAGLLIGGCGGGPAQGGAQDSDGGEGGVGLHAHDVLLEGVANSFQTFVGWNH